VNLDIILQEIFKGLKSKNRER